MWRGWIAEGGKDENEVDKEITRDGILYSACKAKVIRYNIDDPLFQIGPRGGGRGVWLKTTRWHVISSKR